MKCRFAVVLSLYLNVLAHYVLSTSDFLPADKLNFLEFTKHWTCRPGVLPTNVSDVCDNITVTCANASDRAIVGVKFSSFQCSSTMPLNFSLLPPTLLDMDLSFNTFTGTLMMSTLPRNLVKLNLWNNYFSGHVNVSDFPSTLRMAEISMNEFTSVSLKGIPQGLTRLDMSENRFSGTLGVDCGLSKLELLNLRHNMLTGTLESLRTTCTTLTSLDIMENQLSGTIRLGDFPSSLKYLNLNNNLFSGTIHFDEIPEDLTTFSVAHNHFSGEIEWKQFPRSLEVIELTNNSFTGTMDISTLVNLQNLDASNNKLSGSMKLRVESNLQHLYLSNNRLEGTLNVASWPVGMTNLDLSNNRLSGFLNLTALPKGLMALFLQNNEFSFADPIVFPRTLRTVYLSTNHFCGGQLNDSQHFSCYGVVYDCFGEKTTLSTYVSPPEDICVYVCENCSAVPSPQQQQTDRVINETTVKLPPEKSDFQTTSQIVTAGGSLLVVPPDVILTTQILQLSECKPLLSSEDDTSTSIQRPLISWGRVFEFERKHSRRQVSSHVWEILMLWITTATVYILHALITFCFKVFISPKVSGLKNTCDTWFNAVYQCTFPGLSIQYQLSVVVPMVSNCVGIIVLSSGKNLPLVVFIIFSSLFYLGVLAGLNYFSSLNILYVSIVNADIGNETKMMCSKFLRFRGLWTPRTCDAMGSPFFTMYTDHYRYPHLWIWLSICLAVVMIIPATIDATHTACAMTSILCGIVMSCSGLVHLVGLNVVMTVQGICFVRGVRMCVSGVCIVISGILNAMGSSSNNDDVLSVLRFMAIALGLCETIVVTVSLLWNFFQPNIQLPRKNVGCSTVFQKIRVAPCYDQTCRIIINETKKKSSS
eukprot:PhF_6_TR34960/c0_g1_i4/m.50738